MQLETPTVRKVETPDLVVPHKCRKCGRYYVPRKTPTLNMAGGRRFTSSGWVFTKAGGKFVHDDGTCEACDCDNPPGSGQNNVSCSYCSSGLMPASVLLTFIGQGYVICNQCDDPIDRWLSRCGAALGSYCVPMGSCLGQLINLPWVTCAFTDPGCTHFDPRVANIFPGLSRSCCDFLAGYPSGQGGGSITAQYGPKNLDAFYKYIDPTNTTLGWRVTAAGYSVGVDFMGWEASPDCTSPVIITNDAGTLARAAFDTVNPNWNFYWSGTGGSLALTPQAQLCL